MTSQWSLTTKKQVLSRIVREDYMGLFSPILEGFPDGTAWALGDVMAPLKFSQKAENLLIQTI